MAKTSKNILDEARATIKQIDIDEARRMLEKPGTVLVDVRESDEWRQGHIPQAIAIPRGFLELRVEEKVPDHKTPVILQCASGTRSLLAARTLRELGYENVYNLTGGFNAWKDRGLPWMADRQFTADEIDPLLAPFRDSRGRREGTGQAARRQGAAARRGRVGLAVRALSGGGGRRHDRAWSISTWSISRTCSAR